MLPETAQLRIVKSLLYLCLDIVFRPTATSSTEKIVRFEDGWMVVRSYTSNKFGFEAQEGCKTNFFPEKARGQKDVNVEFLLVFNFNGSI